MRVDWDTGTVEDMEPDEVLLFTLYQDCTQATGLSRDWLPYTPEFDQLLADYQKQAGVAVTKRDFWRRLGKVLKPGVENIRHYLDTLGP